MDGTAIKAMMAEIAPVIRDYIGSSLGPVVKRIDALESRQPERGEKGEPGEPGPAGAGVAGAMIDRSGVLILTLSDGRTCELGQVVGKDGADADAEAIATAVGEQLDARIDAKIEALPPPEPGEKGEKGEPGESLDPDELAAEIERGAQKVVAAAIDAMILQPAEKGVPGEPGRDGCGIKDLVIDRDGNLVATLDDGRVKELGPIVGKDGAPGEKGIDGKDGRDGLNGKDGRDGFNLEDFDCESVDERTIKLMFTRGDTMNSFELEFPVIIDRGVFKEGQTYARGDAVTWGGSLWIAQKETDAKPDTADSGWRLAVKKGRDGRNAK